MGFFRQHVWAPRPSLSKSTAQLAPSDSDQSFTNFPVNQETKHPLRSISSGSLATVLAQSSKENIGSPLSTFSHPSGYISLDTYHHITNRSSVATLRQAALSVKTLVSHESTGTEDYSDSRRLGLRRKLSKVRSLADVRSALSVDSRNKSSRRSEVRVDRSSFHSSFFRSREEAHSSLHTSDVDVLQTLDSSSFAKRKMSSDSSMHVAFKKQAFRSVSPEVASIPVISSPIPCGKTAGLPNEATFSEKLDAKMQEQSSSRHSSSPILCFENDIQKSTQSSGGSPHFYYLLPDITEEIQSRRVSIDGNPSIAANPIISSTSNRQTGLNPRSITCPNTLVMFMNMKLRLVGMTLIACRYSSIRPPRLAISASARRQSVPDLPTNTVRRLVNSGRLLMQ